MKDVQYLKATVVRIAKKPESFSASLTIVIKFTMAPVLTAYQYHN